MKEQMERRSYEQCARLRDDCVRTGFLDLIRGCYGMRLRRSQWRIFRPEEIVFLLMRDDELYTRACGWVNAHQKAG